MLAQVVDELRARRLVEERHASAFQHVSRSGNLRQVEVNGSVFPKSGAAKITSKLFRMFKRLRPLFPYLKKYRRGLVLGGVSVLLNNGIWILYPLVIGRAANDLRAWYDHHLTTEALRHNLAIWALLFMAVIFLKGIFQFLTRWVVIGISRDIEFDLRNDLFKHLEQ